MPMIDFTLPNDSLSPEAIASLMDDLSATLIKWEGAPDNGRTRSVTWAFVRRLPPRDIFVGGRALDAKPYYRIDIAVPDKTLLRDNDARKAGLIGEMTRLILAAEGSPDDEENTARVWCLINEVPDGNWGAFADQFRMRTILEYIGHTPVPKDKAHEVPLPE